MRQPLGIVTLAALGAAAQAQVPETSFDTQRVAVKPASGRGIPDVVDALDALDVTVVRPVDYPVGMVLAELSEAADGVTLAERLADDERIRFATAVERQGELLAFATPTMLVRFVDRSTDMERDALLSGFPALSLLEKDYAGVRRVWKHAATSRTGDELSRIGEALTSSPIVEWAAPERNHRIRFSDCDPLDCAFHHQWALKNTGQASGTPGMDINVSDAWCTETGDFTLNVAILDSGIENHPDLNWNGGFDFTGGMSGGLPEHDCERHGTSVAGVVSALRDNLTYIPGFLCPLPEGGLLTGIAPVCRITSFRIAEVPCGGDPVTTGGWIASALSSADGYGARITVSAFSVTQTAFLADVYDETRADGTLHVAASGNAGFPFVEFPASLASVIAVGGIDRTGARWDDANGASNFGPALACVAPAAEVHLLDRVGSVGFSLGPFTQRSGTSYAAPHVAGVAALLFSHEPQLNALDVELMITRSARDLGAPGFDVQFGNGLLDAAGAFAVFDDAFVAAGAAPGGLGTPGQPFDTVGEGVGAVVPGEQVYIAPGTYTETITVTTPMEFIAEEGTFVIR